MPVPLTAINRSDDPSTSNMIVPVPLNCDAEIGALASSVETPPMFL